MCDRNGVEMDSWSNRKTCPTPAKVSLQDFATSATTSASERMLEGSKNGDREGVRDFFDESIATNQPNLSALMLVKAELARLPDLPVMNS